MPNKLTPGRSRILPVVIVAFALILLAMGASWLISAQQMKELSAVLAKSRATADKMDLVASMTETARARSRLTTQMLHTDDVFERDNIGMAMEHKAAEFAVLRQQLMEAGISPQERTILDRQSIYIRSSLPQQRQAAELAISGLEADRKRAAEIIFKTVYPEQGIVVDHFMQLLELQKTQLDGFTEQSLNKLRSNSGFNLGMIFFVLICALGIIIFIIRHVRRIEAQLVLEKEKAQVTLRSIGDGVITLSGTGKIEYLNQVALDLIGDSSGHLVGSSFEELFNKNFTDEKQLIWECIQKVLSTGRCLRGGSNMLFGLASNPALILKGNVSAIADIHHHISGVVISFHDITEPQTLLKKIQHQASYDALTTLLNRRAFEEKVKQMLGLYDRNSNHTFCILDLDHFKAVNDTAGHIAGDELLRQLARSMEQVLRKSDLLSRLGGDEFALFLSNINPNESIRLVEKLLSAVQQFELLWEDKRYRVGVSIGMVNLTAEFSDYESLYQMADAACYVAKGNGRNQIHLMPLGAEMMERKAQEIAQLALPL